MEYTYSRDSNFWIYHYFPIAGGNIWETVIGCFTLLVVTFTNNHSVLSDLYCVPPSLILLVTACVIRFSGKVTDRLLSANHPVDP